jgi:hypothetical protein
MLMGNICNKYRVYTKNFTSTKQYKELKNYVVNIELLTVFITQQENKYLFHFLNTLHTV